MTLSLEVHGIIAHLKASGVPFQVTSTTGGKHAPNSYHYAEGTGGPGLAVDFDDFSSPALNTPGLRAIYNAFVPVRSRLAELLGPGDPGHDNHVHVAVRRGTFLTLEATVPDTPVKLIAAFPYQDGYVLVAEDGAVYCFNCTYHGGLRWDGSFWVPR